MKKWRTLFRFFSGLGVNALGHSHPAIVEAINDQINRFSHVSNFFITDVQLEFAEKLLKYSEMSKVFLTNSGTEAVEAALKAVRRIKNLEGEILSFTKSYHGRTYGALSLTDRIEYKKEFEPLLPQISKITFNDEDDLIKKVNDNTAAIFMEFVQGESGINIITDCFVDTITRLKEKYDFAIIADCIQSGIGRTGKPYAFNYFNIKPDIVLVAKSIGGGLPLGAILTRGVYDEAFSYGVHGSTFGGNPVSCTAGIVVLDEVFGKGLVNSVAELGEYFISELRELSNKFPSIINDVRGLGFMIGVETTSDCDEIVNQLRERKVLINCTNQNVIRILPPLIATKNDIDFFLYNFHEVLKSL
ncbi:MAG: aminotransferase class III-fold pyridoxal phosphate-dependent enzyme [Ignavibacterium sp.]|nr:MAG: aminotransferase class III-fold pyridoxal phosphate-dependent enzyme [Ignavibacterium sp.]